MVLCFTLIISFASYQSTFYASLTLYLFLSRDEYESEGSEASDDDGRPFTRTELQAKVMKTVRKRESAARREGFRYDLSDAREKAKKDKGKGGKR